MFKTGTVLRCLAVGNYFTSCKIDDRESNFNEGCWASAIGDIVIVIDIKKVKCDVWKKKAYSFYVLHGVHGFGHAHFIDEEQAYQYVEVCQS